jgi:PAS domain S-box-containing protein
MVTWFSTMRAKIEEELRRARDRLEVEVEERTQQASLLNLTHDTIFVRDMNDVISYWNRGAQELYGWTAEQAIGQPSHELLKTVYPSPVEEIRAELLASGRWEGELEKTRADGSRVTVASRWSLRRDDQGQPAAILETNNDITEHKRREQEIRSLNQDLGKRTTELEATNKELEAFAYSVSHDLRAPLRHMSGFAELLQKNAGSTLNEKSSRYLTIILDSAKRFGQPDRRSSGLLQGWPCRSPQGAGESGAAGPGSNRGRSPGNGRPRGGLEGESPAGVAWRPVYAADGTRQPDCQCRQVHSDLPAR